MVSVKEMHEKEGRARELMEIERLDALALTSVGNFAWFTCGGCNCVNASAEAGVASVVLTRDAKYLVTNNNEARRMEDEEVTDQGFEFKICNWFENRKNDTIMELAGNGVLGSDVSMDGAKNIGAALAPYRYSLTPEEIERYRWIGRNVGECLAQAGHDVEPGISEHEAGSLVARGLIARGLQPIVALIAADDRIRKYRHPVPTDQTIKRYVMLVTCARKWGLIAAATRLVHFGEISTEIKRKHDALASVDATFIANTRVGADVSAIFRRAMEVYAETGFADEWMMHHQGGATGYQSREYVAHPDINAVVQDSQAFAWNPSITGTKSEDTIIATPDGPEIISEVSDWPAIEVDVDGVKVRRPDILVR